MGLTDIDIFILFIEDILFQFHLKTTSVFNYANRKSYFCSYSASLINLKILWKLLFYPE